MEDKDTAFLLGEMKSDIKTVLKKLEQMSDWQETHEEKDSDRIGKIHQRIDGMNKYAASVALVACAIGASAKLIYSKLVG